MESCKTFDQSKTARILCHRISLVKVRYTWLSFKKGYIKGMSSELFVELANLLLLWEKLLHVGVVKPFFLNFAIRPEVHTMSQSDKKPIIKNADMDDELQKAAIDMANMAMEKFNVEKDMAAFIKKEFDKAYNPTWHCIVGKHFGSYVTHETKYFIYFYVGTYAFLLFKSG